jgi:hypothetical protein
MTDLYFPKNSPFSKKECQASHHQHRPAPLAFILGLHPARLKEKYPGRENEIIQPLKTINSVHPQTPSPLAGEGWGEGDHRRRVLKFSILATPTPSLPEAVK